MPAPQTPFTFNAHRWWTGLCVALALAAVFVLGEFTATKRIFPFHELQRAKHLLFGQSVPDDATLVTTPYWRDRQTHFADLHGTARNVMLGDSLTDGGEWNELFPDHQVANRGINGDTTYGLRRRLSAVVALRPAKVFILVGHNDFQLNRQHDDIWRDYVQVLDTLKSAGITPVIQSTLLTAPKEPAEDAINQHIQWLNGQLEALAAERGIAFVDLNQTLSANGVLRPEVTNDGVHLNGRGYRLWRQAILPLMAP